MASTTLTGSYSGSNASNYAIRCVCSSTSNGSTANTSDVTVTLQMRRTADVVYDWRQWNLDGSATGRIIINGSDSGTSSVTFDTRGTTGWITLKTYTVKGIAHNSDGSKSITIKAYFEPNAKSTLYGGYVSGTFTLDTIPRATAPTLSVDTVTMGKPVTITIKPASSDFKHKIRYSFGSLTGQTNGLKVGTAALGTDFTDKGNVTVTFTPPTSLGSQIPKDPDGTCTIYCYTYNSSGTQIGNATTETLKLNVPPYTLTGSISLKGNNLLQGEYVQGKSTITGTITHSTSEDLYGATIKSVKTSVDGKYYTANPFTSSVLSKGTKTVSVTITDTRNKAITFSHSSAIEVREYTNPYITSFKVERQSDETTVIATLVGGISSVNGKNTPALEVTLNGQTRTGATTATTIIFTDVPTDTTLIATGKISDSYITVSKNATLPTVAVTLDFLADGKGIAMGKVAETTNTFEVAWKTKLNKAAEITDGALATLTLKRNHTYNGSAVKFQNDTGVLGFVGMYGNAVDRPLRRWTSDAGTSYIVLDTGNTADYVIEQGTSNGWNYTKWNNGRIELYGDKSLTFPAGTTVATGLNRSIVTIELSSLLTTIISGNCPIQYNGMIPQLCRHTTYPTRAEIVILTNRDIAGFTITVPIYIIGKWK